MTGGGSSTDGWVLAVNAAAGSSERDLIGRAVLLLARHGQVRVRPTESAEDVVAAATEHPEARLVVVGGDGTISQAADRLIAAGLSERPVGLLPAGTGNDFVRTLGIPLDIEKAADALLDASPRKLSALRIGDRHGVNVAHAGIGATAARRASGWKDRFGPLAYPAGAAVSGVSAGPWRVEVRADDSDPVTADVLMVVMALGETIGGGHEVASGSSVRSATAQVSVARGRGPRGKVRLGVALLRGELGGAGGVTELEAVRLELTCTDGVPLNLDGEDLGDRSQVAIEVVPEAWTVLVPAASARN